MEKMYGVKQLALKNCRDAFYQKNKKIIYCYKSLSFFYVKEVYLILHI